MANRFRAPLYFNQNRAIGMALDIQSGSPASPVDFQVYGDSGSHNPMYWNATKGAWRSLDAAALTDIPVTAIVGLQAFINATPLSSFAQPTAAVNFGGQEITNILAGGSSTSAVRLDQVQTLIANATAGSKAIKDPARLRLSVNTPALTGNITCDGIASAPGDRIFVDQQTDATRNGIYVAASGAWTRSTDMTSGNQLEEGTVFLITEGATQSGAIYRSTNVGAVTIGTTSLTFAQTAQANVYTPDNNTIYFTGMVISAKLDPSGNLTQSGAGIAVNTTTIMRRYVGTFTGDGTLTSFTSTHNLNNSAPIVAIYDATGYEFDVDKHATDANHLVFVFSSPPANGAAFSYTLCG